MTALNRISLVLEKKAKDQGDRVFWISGEKEISYLVFFNSVKCLAKNLLATGIKKGDRVGIWMSNRLEFTLIEMAANYIGAVGVPISTRYKAAELEYILQHSGTRILFMMDELVKIDFFGILGQIIPDLPALGRGAFSAPGLPKLEQIVSLCQTGKELPAVAREFYQFHNENQNTVSDRDLMNMLSKVTQDELSYIQYTSGSTGLPKGVCYSHQQVLLSATVQGERWELTAEDRMLLVAPFFHGLGHMAGPPMGICFGASVIPLEIFDAGKALDYIGKYQCTTLAATPTVYQMMMEHPDFRLANLKSLRAALVTAAPAPKGLKTEIMEKFPYTRLKAGYGSTETGGGCCQSAITDPPELVEQTIGQPLRTYKVKVIDPDTGQDLPPNVPGELCCSGPCTMLGYYGETGKKNSSIDEEGWFHSGDLAQYDEKGYLKIVGRIKELIITGGNNVYPVEVEAMLEKHPLVKEAQVVGVPHKIKGEAVMTFLVLQPGGSCSEKEIREFCQGKISNYKIPEYVRFLNAFPLSAAGKVLKQELRKRAATEVESR